MFYFILSFLVGIPNEDIGNEEERENLIRFNKEIYLHTSGDVLQRTSKLL